MPRISFRTMDFRAGSSSIRAADASRTQILGNFKFDYATKPVSCPEYPWMARTFMKSHIEIECDPVVWHRVEELIRARAAAGAGAAATARNGSR